MIKDLVLKNRSYRRFYQEEKIARETLIELVDIARQTASAANKQPTRYALVCDEETNAKVFDTLGWARYLKDWDGPEEGERPAGYIILVSDKKEMPHWDEGIIGQTILLAATEIGLGGCMLANIKNKELAEILGLDGETAPKMVIALGKPKEKVVLEDIAADGDIKYYRDEEQTHHVPKICLEDVIL